MAWRHRHQWKTLSRKFSPRRIGQFKMGEGTQEMIERMLYGITTINQECEDCGLGRAYTVAGDAT